MKLQTRNFFSGQHCPTSTWICYLSKQVPKGVMICWFWAFFSTAWCQFSKLWMTFRNKIGIKAGHPWECAYFVIDKLQPLSVFGFHNRSNQDVLLTCWNMVTSGDNDSNTQMLRNVHHQMDVLDTSSLDILASTATILTSFQNATTYGIFPDFAFKCVCW